MFKGIAGLVFLIACGNLSLAAEEIKKLDQLLLSTRHTSWVKGN